MKGGRLKEEREGQIFYNTNNNIFTVINYVDSHNVQVEFESGYKTWTRWERIKQGYVKDLYSPNKSGFILDMDKANSNDPNIELIYSQFVNMHTRESNDNYHISRPLSAGITICPEWMYFSNFYKWVNLQSNFPYLIQQSERICVEKDILIKNNKLYSPLTCCLVPSSINALVCIHSTIRGKYPLGITEACDGKCVIAKWQNPITHQGEWSTVFPNTPEGIQKAFDVYKYNREKYIKEKANIYYKKHLITEPCYKALLNFTINIDD